MRKSMILRKLLVVTWLVFITSACGPIFSPTLPGPIFIYTNTPTPTLTPLAGAITPTPSSATAAAVAVTGSYFTLIIDSNCYDGPGESYNIVVIIQSGEIVQVIGRNQENTWWRIYNDISAGCWIANEVGTFAGNAALIPITSSGLATKAWTPLPPTKEKPDSSNPPSSNNPQPTNPPPTNPPPTDPPPTDPPPTDPPATDPPPTQPPICLPLFC
jgi:hypothetical protein